VLSPATAAYDRGEKFAAYRRIPSLRDFVLIDPDLRRIEHYRRNQDERWELQDIAPEQALVLESLEVSIPWQKVFRNAD
jgi:Uncharacterized protein conserved in cyanobacteria